MEDNSNEFHSLESSECNAKPECVENAASGDEEWIPKIFCNNKIITDPIELLQELNKRDNKRFLETVNKCKDDDLLINETDPFDPTTEIDFPDVAFQKDLELLTFKCDINNSSTPVAQVPSMTSYQYPEQFSTANMSHIAKPKQSYTEAPPDKECFAIVQEIGNLLLKLQKKQVRNMQLKEDSLLDINEKPTQYEVPSNEYYMINVQRSETDGTLAKCVVQAVPFLKSLSITESALVWTPSTGQELRTSLVRQPTVPKKPQSRIPTKSIIDIHLPNPDLNTHFNIITPPIRRSSDLLPIPKNTKNQKATKPSNATNVSSAINFKEPTKERSLSSSKLAYTRR